jgi:hypothetical protein
LKMFLLYAFVITDYHKTISPINLCMNRGHRYKRSVPRTWQDRSPETKATSHVPSNYSSSSEGGRERERDMTVLTGLGG